MSYRTPDTADIAALLKIVPKDRLFSGDEIGEDYSHDELGGVSRYPDVLVKVVSTGEVSKIMRYANEHMIPVVARGSGTGLVGGGVPLYGGIMIDLTLMNHVLELDEENLTVTVEPGVLLMDLSAYCEEHGFLYPPDPGEKSATIGGNISTNAGGMRAVKYGTTREYVRGLTVVLPTGEVLELGGKVVKNSSGYSIKDLVIGSEGTLAIVTEAILKLVPLPQTSISLLCPFGTMKEAIEAVPKIIRSKVIPTAIEYMSRETIMFAEDFLGKRFPDTGYEAYILLTFDGIDDQSVDTEYKRVADLCLDIGAKDVFIVDTEERKKSVWSARGAFLEAIKASTDEMDECDVVVPRNKIADYILFTHELSRDMKVRIPSFGHAGDGNLHIYICRDRMPADKWQSVMKEAFDRLYDKATEMGGLVSGEHGIGFAKKSYMQKQYGAEQLAIMKGIKAAFDPNCILNPGKICL